MTSARPGCSVAPGGPSGPSGPGVPAQARARAGAGYFDGYDGDSDSSQPQLQLAMAEKGKLSRKQAEKQRRTVLNRYIGQLASLVPLVAESSKKVDKTSILRLAAHDLRKEHVFGDSIRPCHTDVGPAAADAFLEMLGGFLLTVTVKGLIVVVSSNVLAYLGYSQLDLLGQNIMGFMHPEDVGCVRDNLSCNGTDHGALGERRDFLVRLARAGSRAEPPQYSVCRIDGAFRRSDRAGSGPLHPIRRQRVRKDAPKSPSGNDLVFVGLVRVLDHAVIPDRLLEAGKQEYWTRHLVDGRIVHCDQRISLVAGYMSEEVTGVSAFTFMHREDVRWVVIALRQMYDESNPYGESCYRLMSRTGQFMYLRTKGFLEIDRQSKEAQSFVCINSLVSDEDGAQLIRDMRKRYSAIIDLDESDLSLQLGAGGGYDMSVEDPLQLEQVIIHLISNLPSGALRGRRGLASDSDGSPQSSPYSADSLTIIPPTPSAVKSSIDKSISVMSLSGALKRVGSSPGPSLPALKRKCGRPQQATEADEDYG